MSPIYLHIQEAVGFLQKQTNSSPLHTIILGTGLKNIVQEFEVTARIPLRNIPHFPPMTVPHMDDTLYTVQIDGWPVWILGGRLHYYEGHTMEQVTFPIRLLAEAGTRSFFLTNAAGNVNPGRKAGDILLMRDHINWSFPSPLIGINHPEWGSRYPEMTEIYSSDFNEKLLDYAHQSGFQLDTGVYLGLTGPQLETPAEYRLFHQLGADMVGMSTIPEAIVAAHMDRKITALSVLSNDASESPIPNSTTMEAIMSYIRNRKDDVSSLIRHWVKM